MSPDQNFWASRQDFVKGTDPTKNTTNNPISSNSHPSANANKAVHCIKRGTGITKTTGT